ncbi:MAG: aminotransferase class IV [Sedimentisphaerales bacterium]|nr:aminotransferase class IV [Sedimentisphaerales bacterium]
MKLAMVDDRFVPIESLDPAHCDRGLYFGDGVYEVLRSYNGKIFALDDHMDRFAASMAAIRITGIDIGTVRQRVEQAFKAAGLPNARIYFHVTRGSAARNHSWDPNLKPNFLLTVSEVKDQPVEKARGIAVCTHPDLRWKRCDIKSLNLLPNVLARQYAVERGCDEAILVDEAGFITEGTSSAFFAINQRALQTAPLSANILPSITRKFVVRAAQNVGIAVEECCLTPKQAAVADELFLAVTTKDIVPVVIFDGATIGDGKPGPLTKALTAEFLKFTL